MNFGGKEVDDERFYLMALLKFCADIRYRDIFPTRQTWIYSLSAVEANNSFVISIMKSIARKSPLTLPI